MLVSSLGLGVRGYPEVQVGGDRGEAGGRRHQRCILHRHLGRLRRPGTLSMPLYDVTNFACCCAIMRPCEDKECATTEGQQYKGVSSA